MSSLSPVFNISNITALIDWLQVTCKSADFDPNLPSFQAAIAVLASNEAFRRSSSLQFIDPKDCILSTGNIPISNFSSIAQILMHRMIIRKMNIPPSFQRAV